MLSLSPIDGPRLLDFARSTIGHALGHPSVTPPSEPYFQAPAATFVTLMKQEELRGCMGSLEAHRSLLQDLQENALAAAFHDPRFSPLQLHEFTQVRIEVSLLSALEALPVKTEEEALRMIRPHTDGLVLKAGWQRGTFLPQVWEQLPNPKEFLQHLKQKAGLPAQGWESHFRLYRYTVRKWKETS